MAIYSLHHSSIGKSTQAQAYTAGAHADYITRESAMSHLDGEGIPTEKAGAIAFLRVAEDRLRANGRVADKIMLALPRGLSADQRVGLVRAFAGEVTQNRAPWLAAFHDKGKDARNPHCHLMICDRDMRTGKRVFQTTEKGSTERLRELWEMHANRALKAASRSERIDRRTLAAQGIIRERTIHVGVRASVLVRKLRPVQSQERVVRNHCQARRPTRKVAYPAIDKGKLRLAHNIEVRRRGLLASRPAGRESEYWQAIDQDAFLRDIRELKRLHAVLEYGEDRRDFGRSRVVDQDLERGR